MKKYSPSFLLLLLVFLLLLPSFGWGATSYVDNTCTNAITTYDPATPACTGGSATVYDTLAHVATAITGDQHDNSLLLRKGQTFPGTLTLGAYGTSGHPFTISSFGTGNKPIINPSIVVSSWTAVTSTQYFGYNIVPSTPIAPGADRMMWHNPAVFIYTAPGTGTEVVQELSAYAVYNLDATKHITIGLYNSTGSTLICKSQSVVVNSSWGNGTWIGTSNPANLSPANCTVVGGTQYTLAVIVEGPDIYLHRDTTAGVNNTDYVAYTYTDGMPASISAGWGPQEYKYGIRAGVGVTTGAYSTAATTQVTMVYEDTIPLQMATSSSCSDGNWFWAANVLYYKPTSGTPANHTVGYGIGPYAPGYNGITVSDKSYITIDGIRFVNADVGVYAYENTLASNHITVKNSDFIYNYIGIMTNANTDFNNGLVDGNYFYRTSRGVVLENIATSGTQTSQTITNNNLVDMGTIDGTKTWSTALGSTVDQEGIGLQNSVNGLVSSNTISGGVNQAIIIYTEGGAISSGNTISRNYISDNKDSAIVLQAESGCAFNNNKVINNKLINNGRVSAADHTQYTIYIIQGSAASQQNYVENNTIYGGYDGIDITNSTPFYFTIKNNIISGNSRYNIVGINTLDGTFISDYNLHHSTNSNAFVNGTEKTLAQWQAYGFDSNSVIADPLFLDATGGNFGLKHYSPAIGTGLYDSNVHGVAGCLDYPGYPCSRGGNVDIGAYQHKPLKFGNLILPGIKKMGQSLTWNSQPGAMTVGDADQSLVAHASASSGLTPAFTTSSSSSICTIVSNQLHAVGAGNCVVHSDQDGDANYLPAARVDSGTVVISAGAGISDNFNRADGAVGSNWTASTGSTWAISSNTLHLSSSGSVFSLAYTGTATNTVNQYAKITMTAFETGTMWDYPSLLFRFTNNGSPVYAVVYAGHEHTIQWERRPTAAGSGTSVQSASKTASVGDTLCATISGTGNATVVNVWFNCTGNSPSAYNSWGGAAPDFNFTNNPASAVDTGNYVGVTAYNQNATPDMAFDDFFGGDCP